MTCRDARYVFVPSDLVRDTMISDYGCEPERVVRVGFGTAIYEPELPPRTLGHAGGAVRRHPVRPQGRPHAARGMGQGRS